MKTVAALLLVLCYLAGSHAWNCREGPRLSSITQIDAGLGKVVAVNRFNQAFVLIGTRWYRLSSVSLKHISVGPAGMWGASNTNRVYKSVAGNMLQSSGIYYYYFHVNKCSLYCPTCSSSLIFWSSLGRAMRYYSCSPNNGCWGVDTSFRVYFTQRIVPSNCGNSGWLYVAGQSMTMIEVGTDGSVFGVNRSGQVFQRIGISIRLPQGSAWRSVPMCMSIRHVSYDLGRLWAVTTSGLLMQCTH
ncbi:fish-egg lectin-like [Seriola lalandi dorsalis]|nr:fish-egg lectin-like [Seriola lalandi dorsalis]